MRRYRLRIDQPRHGVRCRHGHQSPNPRSNHVHYLIGIVVFVGLTVGAIALGVKFFDTSVSEQEKGKKW